MFSEGIWFAQIFQQKDNHRFGVLKAGTKVGLDQFNVAHIGSMSKNDKASKNHPIPNLKANLGEIGTNVG